MSDFVDELAKNGLALPTLPSILGLTLGGAIATSTHGTGHRCQTLPAYIESLTLMKADGTLGRVKWPLVKFSSEGRLYRGRLPQLQSLS